MPAEKSSVKCMCVCVSTRAQTKQFEFECKNSAKCDHFLLLAKAAQFCVLVVVVVAAETIESEAIKLLGVSSLKAKTFQVFWPRAIEYAFCAHTFSSDVCVCVCLLILSALIWLLWPHARSVVGSNTRAFCSTTTTTTTTCV